MRCARYLCICFSPVVLSIQSFNGIMNPQFKGAFKKAFSCGQWNLMTFGLKIYNLKLQYNLFPKPFFREKWVDTVFVLFFMSVNSPRLSKRKNSHGILETFLVCCRKYVGLHRFFFTLLCDWSSKLAPPSRPIRGKSKTKKTRTWSPAFFCAFDSLV